MNSHQLENGGQGSGVRGQIFLFSVLCFLFSVTFSGCQKESNPISLSPTESLKKFSFNQRDGGEEWIVKGEAATFSEKENIRIKNPDATLKTKTGKTIWIKTKPEGKAEILMDNKTNKIKEFIATGGVTIQQLSDEGTDFTTESEKAIYKEKERELVLSGNPVVYQGENTFQGEVIRYFIDEGRIVIERSAQGKFYYKEEKKQK